MADQNDSNTNDIVEWLMEFDVQNPFDVRILNV